MLRIGIVIQNLIDSRGIGGELLRALMSTFFKHCVLRAEQRSAFLQVSFTYAKIFLAAFVKKRKKRRRGGGVLGNFIFFPIAPKWGWYCFQDTDRFEVTTTVVTNSGPCRANKIFLLFLLETWMQARQLESIQSDTNYCNASTFTAKANQSLIKAEP